MNISDLQPGSYKIISTGNQPLNVNNLAPGSYSIGQNNFATQSSPGDQAGVFQKASNAAAETANFLGIQKAGQGTATALNMVGGGGNVAANTQNQDLPQFNQLIQTLHSLPANDPRRQQLAQALKNNQAAYTNAPTQDQIDPGSALSNKEVLGSFGNLGLDIAGSGELTSGAKFGGTIATKAPELMDALNTGTRVIQKVTSPLSTLTKAGRIGNAAIKGAEFGAAQGATQGMNDNQSAGNIAKSAATGSLLQGILGGTLQGASEATKYLTSPTVSEHLYNSGIGVNKKTILADKSPAASMIQQGKFGTATALLNDAQKTIDNHNQQISGILQGNNTKVDTNALVSQIRSKLLNQYGDTLGQDGVDKLMSDLPIAKLNENKTLSINDINSLRQKIDKDFIGNNKWISINQDPVKISSFKTAANVLRNTVQASDKRLPGLFSGLTDAITARNSLDNKLAAPHALTTMLEILGAIGAGGTHLAGGGGLASIGTAAAAYGGEKLANSTIGKTAAAVALDRTGQALKNPGVIQQGVKAAGRIAGRRSIAKISSTPSQK